MITISNDPKFVLTYHFQHVQSDPPTAKSLAQLISQMIQFQEDCLGKGAKNPQFPRLPVSFMFIPTCMLGQGPLITVIRGPWLGKRVMIFLLWHTYLFQ